MSRVRFVSKVFLVTFLFLSLGMAVQVASSSNQTTPTIQGAQVISSATGDVQFLTGPNRGNPSDIALGYIHQNLSSFGLTQSDYAHMIITDQYISQDTGVTHIYMRQTYEGIELYNGNLNINIAADGRVINLGISFVSNLQAAVQSARLTGTMQTPQQAVTSGADQLNLKSSRPLTVQKGQSGPARETIFGGSDISREQIPAKLVYVAVAPNTVRLAWNVEIYELDAEHWWSMLLDAYTGELLGKYDYVVSDTFGVPASGSMVAPRSINAATQASTALQSVSNAYNVFALPKESPTDGPRTLEVNPANPLASPFGWHDTNGVAGPEFTITRGNNAHAYTDIDNNNQPDLNSSPDGGPDLVLDFPLDLAQEPNTSRPAAVTNLFYWNNIIHDVAYLYGFTEASGNFQVNNYGRGGAGNDDVRAEAQDGGGTNNANMSTGSDGSRPRMQMYLWDYPFPNIVTVNVPSPVAGDYVASGASYGPTLLQTGPITGDVVYTTDGGGVATTDACEPLVDFPSGSIAMADRGTCNFIVKTQNAQAAGAIGLIVINNTPAQPAAMGGAGSGITIPSVMISLADGGLLIANLPLNATLRDSGNPGVGRDGDFDAGIVAHEYTHGISNRLTGGPSTANCLNNSEQMGEGWSDFLGIVLTAVESDTATTNRGVGTYALFQDEDGIGIRPTPYNTDMTVNPVTYGDLGGLAIPHGVGYAWNSMLWEVYWNLVDAHGFNPNIYDSWTTGGNNLALQLVMNGMKLQVCRPGFVDGRNAILLADQLLTNGVNQCYIWQGFAKRGLGFSASQGSNTNTTDGVEAFDLPVSCQGMISVSPTSLHSSQLANTQTNQLVTVSNTNPLGGSADLDWTVTEAATDCAAPSDLTWISAAPTSGSNGQGSSTDLTVTFDSTGLTAPAANSGLLCLNSNDPSNSVVAVPVSLQVTYNFSGFMAPISSAPTINAVQAGAVIPVKFSLNGDYGLNIFANGYPKTQQINCQTLAPSGSAVPTSTVGGTSLMYDANTNEYIYPWKSVRGWAGTCRQLIVRLNDGMEYIAYFNFN
jgi:hypothetical protein